MNGTITNGNPDSSSSPRWKIWLAIGATAGTLAVGGVALAIFEPWAKPPPSLAERLSARVELAAGEVMLHGEDGSQRLLSGAPLPEAASLETGAGARALIRLGDGSRVYLDENTKLVVEAGIRLQAGRVWIDAPALERGREPLLHAVDSTTITLAEGGASLERTDQTSIYVAEGLAIVTTAGGRTEVDAGERARVAAEGAPSVEAVAFWDDWTGGMGDRAGVGSDRAVGSGSLYAVDRQAPAGSPALPLSIQRQSVQVVMRDQVAETLVDQRFFNPTGRDVEGYYWFSVPPGSQLVSFALETDGQLVEGEVVERQQASTKYEAAVQRRNDPALLEWIDASTVRARIFPVPALGTRRIVVRYQALLSETGGRLRYTYPLAGPSGKDAPTIEEFALAVDLGELPARYDLATLGEARIEDDGKRVTMRRTGYTPRSDFQLELRRKASVELEPMRLSIIDPGNDQARYVMVRYAPKLDFERVPTPKGEVVVVVDTSAAGDASEHETRLAVAEALLRSLSRGDSFAVMSADVTAEVLYPSEGLAEATPEAVTAAIEALAQRSTGGATDLGAIFEQALGRVHGLSQPAVIYVGDGLATSGERGGDALAQRVRRNMVGSSARLFTVGVGQDIDAALLDRLARMGGGDSLRVETPAQAVSRALALSGALKTPTITDLEIGLGEGLDEVFYSTSGKLSQGQELVVLARTHHDLPEEISVRGQIGGEAFEAKHTLAPDKGLTPQLVPRLWAGAYVEHLLGDARGPEAVRGKILSLGLEYGLMTPYTSLLALDSEQAYAQMGIVRRSRPLGGVRLTASTATDRIAADPPMPGARRDAVDVMVGVLGAPLGCSMGADEPKKDEAVSRSAEQAAPVEASVSQPVDVPNAPPPMPEGGRGPAFEEDKGGDVMDSVVEREPPSAEPSPGRMVARKSRGGEAPGGKLDKDEGGAGGSAEVSEQSRTPVRTQRVVSPVARNQALPCSDVSARGLAQRRVLWGKRLDTAASMESALRIYEASAGSCEIRSWKDERTFLHLLQARAQTESDIALLVSHFADDADATGYLTRALLRRLIDPALVAAVHNAMYGDRVAWGEVDQRVALATNTDAKIAVLDAALARAPGDPSGERRLLDVLVEGRRISEAIARGRRLRDQGLMTPGLAQALGEALVAHGEPKQAQRVFSEIVEFDPDDPMSRQLLGDIFLRHQWYEGAYRQYEDLRALEPEDALASIRLARAAAGAGRTDEALRVLRQVAAGEGRPGAEDPRRFARLHAAAYLARLHAAKTDEVPVAALERELKRTQLFEGPTIWTLLVWEDLDASLVIAADATRDARVTADAMRAADTGLVALESPVGERARLTVRRADLSTRTIAYHRITIGFDGKAFDIGVEPGVVSTKQPEPEPVPEPVLEGGQG